MATNYQDFLGQGGTGVNVQANPERARQLDPNEQPNPANPGGVSNNELARRKRAELESANLAAAGRQRVMTANQSNKSGQLYIGEDAAARKAADEAKGIVGGIYRTPAEQRQWEQTHQRGFGGNLIRDPVTLGILTAPYAVLGGGFVAGGGALAGAGTEGAAVGGGTLGGVATGTTGSMAAPTMMASPFAATAATPTLSTVGTVASPFAAGALPAMAAPATATASNWLTPSNVIGALGTTYAAGQVLGDLLGGKSKEEEALLAKQEEMAAAAKQRQAEAEQQRLNRLGQQILAFNPRNQMMAEMFGPGAAYTPEQMSGLVADPSLDPQAVNAARTNFQQTGRLDPDQARVYEAARADERRRAGVQAAFAPPGQGPAPIQQRAPQAARRF